MKIFLLVGKLKIPIYITEMKPLFERQDIWELNAEFKMTKKKFITLGKRLIEQGLQVV